MKIASIVKTFCYYLSCEDERQHWCWIRII